MDKMLVAIMTILDMEGQVNTNKAIVKEINEFLAELQEQIAEKCLVVGGLESKWHLFETTLKSRNSEVQSLNYRTKPLFKWLLEIIKSDIERLLNWMKSSSINFLEIHHSILESFFDGPTFSDIDFKNKMTWVWTTLKSVQNQILKLVQRKIVNINKKFPL